MEDLLVCSICCEGYEDKERPPVLLPRCGHSFCRPCIALIQAGGCVLCPTCRTDQRIESANKLPTEYTLLAIIHAQKNAQQHVCSRHSVKLSFWCRTCSMATCGECLFEDHPTHSHDVIRAVQYIADMKIQAQEIAVKFMNALDKREQNFYKSIYSDSRRISNSIRNIGILRKDMDEARNLMRGIKEEETIATATSVAEAAKFLGLKWNIRDVNYDKNNSEERESPQLKESENKKPRKPIKPEKMHKILVAKSKSVAIVEAVPRKSISENTENKDSKNESVEKINSVSKALKPNEQPESKETQDKGKCLKQTVESKETKEAVVKKDTSENTEATEKTDVNEKTETTGRLEETETKKTDDNEETADKKDKPIDKKDPNSEESKSIVKESIANEEEKSKLLASTVKPRGRLARLAAKRAETMIFEPPKDESMKSGDKKVSVNIQALDLQSRKPGETTAATNECEETETEKQDHTKEDREKQNNKEKEDLDEIQPGQATDEILPSNGDSAETENLKDSLSIDFPIEEDVHYTKIPNNIDDVAQMVEEKTMDLMQVHGLQLCVEGVDGRLGRVEWGQSGVHIYAHQFQQLPYDVLIKSNVLTAMIPSKSPIVFMEICADETIIGTVYIKLFGHLRRAHNFLTLCLGDFGPCYKSTNFLQVYNQGEPGERVLGGDYEFNNGRGGHGILDDLEWNGDYAQPMETGMITAAGSGQNATDSLFLLCTEGDETRNFSCPFGIVSSGLEYIKEAIRVSPLKRVWISECGVLLKPPLI